MLRTKYMSTLFSPLTQQSCLKSYQTSCGMYGRNVFQILKKKGVPTEDNFSYGTNGRPSDEVYQSTQSRRLSSFSRIYTIDRVKHAQPSALVNFHKTLASGQKIKF